MTTSGTATFNMAIDEVIEEALERLGITSPSGADMRSSRRSLNLLLQDMANRGELLWAEEPAALALVAGTDTYTLDPDTIELMDVVLRDGTMDIEIERYAYGDYQLIPNKSQTGRPTTYSVRRNRDSVTLYLWPVPAAGTSYELRYVRRRRLEDVGAYGNTLDLPVRVLPAVIAGLAYHMAGKRPIDAGRRGELQAQFESEIARALDEDRSRAPLYLVPASAGGRGA